MNYKKFAGAASAALMIVIVLILMPAPIAWAGGKFKTLYTFNGADGFEPEAGLVFDPAGNLYGTTFKGNTSSGYGVAFQLAPNADGTWSETVIRNFNNGKYGGNPVGSLIFDQAGNLYGTTLQGGGKPGSKDGTVFELSPNADGTWTEKVLHIFKYTDGASPQASLVFDREGNLYGTTVRGGKAGNECLNSCGVVFKLAPNQDGSWTESVLHVFCSLSDCRDGSVPHAALIFDQAGNLYGTTYEGGSHGRGVAFRLTPNSDGSWSEKVLHQFTGGKDGGYLYAPLILDADGNLYGTTVSGGVYEHGVAFELTPNTNGSWGEKVLHQFTGGKDGGNSAGGLIFDQAGSLYGTAGTGGNLNRCKGLGCGVVFKLVPNPNGTWHETMLHRFNGRDGKGPGTGVILDQAGNVYGTTMDYPHSFGTVFEITP